MLAENDGPSMLSYATTGALYGVGFFVPFILITFAMAFVVQEIAARLAIATGRGQIRLIFERYGPRWGRLAVGGLALANALTLVTEFIAICAGARFFGIAPIVAIGATVAVVVASLSLGRYRRWERVVIAAALGNAVFIPAAILAHADPHAVIGSLGSLGALPLADRPMTFVTLCLANVGATVTPWMLFFQQSAVVDKGLTHADLPFARLDTGLGAVLAGVIAVAAVIAASPLFTHHIDPATLSESADFASALRPYLGNAGAAFFALGLIEAGLVAIMTISTTSAYAIGDVAPAGDGLDGRLGGGRLFSLTALISVLVAATIVMIPTAPLLAITISVNVIALLLMPPALVFLLLLINDRQLVGEFANGVWANVAGFGVIGIVLTLGTIYATVLALPGLFPR